MKYILCLFFLASTFVMYGQSVPVENVIVEKREKVKIIDASERSKEVNTKEYFNDYMTAQILKQISPEKLEEVKDNCNYDTYPDCFKVFTNTDDIVNDDEAIKAEKKIFQSLKIYRIAKYTIIHNGQNLGEESILVIPANENKNLGGSCNLTKDIYILIFSKGAKKA